jgi:hypothetical protein
MNDARQQMLERIGEDESLTGDLGGTAAEALRQWANDTALTIAQRTDLDDDMVQQQIRAVRTAARKAAAHDGDLTVAQHELATLIATVSVSSTTAPAPTNQSVPVPVESPPNQPMLFRLRGWWHGLWSRAPKEE